jgi:hypothetical protein
MLRIDRERAQQTDFAEPLESYDADQALQPSRDQEFHL